MIPQVRFRSSFSVCVLTLIIAVTASVGGQQLLSRAVFHAGLHMTRLVRVQPLDLVHCAADVPRRGVLFGSREGSIGAVSPVAEQTFRRLQALQARLVAVLPHPAGMNPKAFRYVALLAGIRSLIAPVEGSRAHCRCGTTKSGRCWTGYC